MGTALDVTEGMILARVGAAGMERARDYVRDGAVYDGRRQGATVRGHCEGSDGGSYSVRATVTAGAITDALCTCPVGGGGDCKHVAALLLTWREAPGDFLEVDAVDQVLRRCSRADLVALVRQMLRQSPDLENLLAIPVPGVRQGRALRGAVPGATARVYRRQADAVFRRHGTDWGTVVTITEEIRALRALGDGFVTQGDPASATAVYEGLAEAVLDRYEAYARQDEDGALRAQVGACVAGLGRCLDALRDDPAGRARVLRVLVDVFDADEDLGDVGPGEAVAALVLKRATVEEHRMVAGWVRALSPGATGWRDLEHADFVLDLEADTLSDEEYLAACGALGRHRDRVARLLTLGRDADALAAAELCDGPSVLGVAEVLMARGHAADAEALVASRAARGADVTWLAWLRERARARGDHQATLDLSLRMFQTAPSMARFREVRAAAGAVGRWESVRPGLHAVAAARHAHGLLAAMHLEEGAYTEALAAVQGERTADPGLRRSGAGMKLRVAEAAERTLPAEALAVYRRHAEDLIAAGGRENYREACGYLVRVKALYDRLGDPDGWAGCAAGVREEHARLRALREELAAAGL